MPLPVKKGGYNDGPGFRRIVIANKPQIEKFSESTVFFNLECRLNPSLTINKRIFIRTRDEGVFKSDEWKLARLCKQAGVEPVSESDDTETYDEGMLYSAELSALVFQNPKTGFLDIFDFLPADALEPDKNGLFSRFDKWFMKKFSNSTPGEEKEIPRETKDLTQSKGETDVNEELPWEEGTEEQAQEATTPADEGKRF